MSSQTETDIVTESPPLFNYLKQEIPLEDLKDYASPRRIQSLDFVKGFASFITNNTPTIYELFLRTD